MSSRGEEICRRIQQIRLELHGPRGKSKFAQELGLSPSTYDYYEGNRVPPAEILVRISDQAGVDLRWLLTGQISAERGVAASHPVVRRIARFLSEAPDAAEPLLAFLDIFGKSLQFPQKPQRTGRAGAPGPASGADAGWIPVLGRSAAGVAHFWSTEAEGSKVTTLQQLVQRHISRPPSEVLSARALEGDKHADLPVQLVSLHNAEGGPVEFVVAAEIKGRYPNAFALRIDGNSMSPDIAHGDLVILSPAAPAADGKAAVVQLKRQIGVTCKLFRRSGHEVHLVPINEQFTPAVASAGDILWALRVLARVRV